MSLHYTRSIHGHPLEIINCSLFESFPSIIDWSVPAWLKNEDWTLSPHGCNTAALCRIITTNTSFDFVTLFHADLVSPGVVLQPSKYTSVRRYYHVYLSLFCRLLALPALGYIVKGSGKRMIPTNPNVRGVTCKMIPVIICFTQM